MRLNRYLKALYLGYCISTYVTGGLVSNSLEFITHTHTASLAYGKMQSALANRISHTNAYIGIVQIRLYNILISHYRQLVTTSWEGNWNQKMIMVFLSLHYCDVITGAMASQITSLTIVYSTVYSGADLVTGEFPARRASIAENVSIWWLHHVSRRFYGPNIIWWYDICRRKNNAPVTDQCFKDSWLNDI